MGQTRDLFKRIRDTESTSTEKEMAPHSSTLAWKIPWTEEPGRLPSYQVGKSPTRGRKELDTTERLYLLNTTENRGLENTIPQ